MIRIALKQASKSDVRWLIAACAAALFALQAEPSWAAQYADALPWDQTLEHDCRTFWSVPWLTP